MKPVYSKAGDVAVYLARSARALLRRRRVDALVCRPEECRPRVLQRFPDLPPDYLAVCVRLHVDRRAVHVEQQREDVIWDFIHAVNKLGGTGATTSPPPARAGGAVTRGWPLCSWNGTSP